MAVEELVEGDDCELQDMKMAEMSKIAKAIRVLPRGLEYHDDLFMLPPIHTSSVYTSDDESPL